MTFHFEITKAIAIDLKVLQEISTQTFLETFAEQNSSEDMQSYLAESFNLEKLKSELDEPNSEFYFATLENDKIAYLKINFAGAQTEFNDSTALEIERIYVLQSYHGKKVGQLLLDWSIAIARQRGLNSVWLGVWEENVKAINFYKKNGFSVFGKHLFKLGGDEQTDLLMKRLLVS